MKKKNLGIIQIIIGFIAILTAGLSVFLPKWSILIIFIFPSLCIQQLIIYYTNKDDINNKYVKLNLLSAIIIGICGIVVGIIKLL